MPQKGTLPVRSGNGAGGDCGHFLIRVVVEALELFARSGNRTCSGTDYFRDVADRLVRRIGRPVALAAAHGTEDIADDASAAGAWQG